MAALAILAALSCERSGPTSTAQQASQSTSSQIGVAEAWRRIREWGETKAGAYPEFRHELVAVSEYPRLGSPEHAAVAAIDSISARKHCDVHPTRFTRLLCLAAPAKVGVLMREARRDRALLPELEVALPPGDYLLGVEVCCVCRSIRTRCQGLGFAAATDWVAQPLDDWPTELSDGVLPDMAGGVLRLERDDSGDCSSQELLSWNGAGSAMTAETLGIDLEHKVNVPESMAPARHLGRPRLWRRPIWSIDLRFVPLD